MAKNFKIYNSDGEELWAAPEGERIMEISVGSDRGELARVRVQDDTSITLNFITTGRLNPNLIDEEEARVQREREFRENNSPEPVMLTQEELDDEDNEEAQEFKRREGGAAAADFTLTSDQPRKETHVSSGGSLSPAGPDVQDSGAENSGEENTGSTPASPGPLSFGENNGDNDNRNDNP